MFKAILIAEELHAHLPLLCRFFNKEQGGLKREKLRHKGRHSIYSLRVNDSTRLLYTSASINGLKCAIVLGEVVSHDYHKSRFLRAKGVLEAFFNKQREQIAAALESQKEADAYEDALESSEDDSEIEPVTEPVIQDYYRLKPFGARLFFEDASQEASYKNTHAQTVIVSGSSGTGKTVSAMNYLHSHAGACRSDGELKRYLYVSSSQYLVTDVYKQMEAALPAEKLACIEFKTYIDLVGTEIHFIERAAVEIYIANELKKLKLDWSPLGGVTKLDDAVQVVHDEWILLAGLGGKLHAYQQLGDDQSYIKKEHQETRQQVHSLYHQFQCGLKEIEGYLPFHSLKRDNIRYDGLIIDEAFLLSFANVLGLSKMSEFTMLLGDSHQAIGAHWLSVFTSQQASGVEHIILKENYRNPSPVIDMLNRVLQVKYYIRPGLRDKYEQGQIANDKARKDMPSLWIDDDWCQHNQNTLTNLTQSTQFAVVILCDEVSMKPEEIEAKKTNIRKRFNTPLVFTRREVQGLEYPVVLMIIDENIRFISNKLARGFAKDILQKGAPPTTRSAEKGVSYAQQQAIDLSSQLYVGFSRAQQQVIVYLDEEAKQLAPDLISFYKDTPQTPQVLVSEPKITTLETSNERWEQERKRQEQIGNQAIAQQIAASQNRLTRQDSKPSTMRENTNNTHSSQRPSLAAMSSSSVTTQTQQETTKNETLFQAPEKFNDGWKKLVSSYKDANNINQVNIERICNSAKSPELFNWVLLGAEVEEGTGETIFVKYVNAGKTKAFLDGIKPHINKLSPLGLNHEQKGGELTASLAFVLCSTEEGRIFLRANQSLLLKIHNASLKAKNNSIIHIALEFGFHESLYALLDSKNNFEINTKDGDKNTPLHIAAREGNLTGLERLISELITRNPSIERTVLLSPSNKDGNTPAHLAAYYGKLEALKVLLKRGASFEKETKNYDGDTIGHVAAYTGQTRTLEFLADKGLLFDIENNSGSTPLHIAVGNNQLEATKLLIGPKTQFRREAKNHHGNTPVHLCAQNGNADILKYLANKNVNLSLPNDSGNSPLHLAAFNNQSAVIKILDEHNVPLQVANNEGYTAQDLANSRGNKNAQKYLIDCNQRRREKNIPTTAIVKQLLSVPNEHYMNFFHAKHDKSRDELEKEQSVIFNDVVMDAKKNLLSIILKKN